MRKGQYGSTEWETGKEHEENAALATTFLK